MGRINVTLLTSKGGCLVTIRSLIVTLAAHMGLDWYGIAVMSVVGEFESAFSNTGQTKEHALLARALGVTQVGSAG